MNTAVEFARAWLPPTIFSLVGRWTGRALRWEAADAGWENALRASSGYDEGGILNRVTEATREVRDGRAKYERDSVLFFDSPPPPPLLFALLRHAIMHPGVLDIVDFGGSLGSTYRLCKPFFPQGIKVRWIVVEQPSFVEVGHREFTNEELSFVTSLSELPTAIAPRLILASSVLQYLEDPTAILEAFNLDSTATLVIDRTPVWDGQVNCLTIQHVPPHIYRASYPCWILSHSELIARLGMNWRVIADYSGTEGRRSVSRGPSFEFRSFILEKNTV